jgi:hypothetical protein
MRRLMPIAAFALFLTLPLWAQRGAGGHAGGHGGGFSSHGALSGGHAGFGGAHVAGGRSFVATRSGMHGSFSPSRGFTHGSSFQHHTHSGDRDRGFRFRNNGFRNSCFGWACRSGYYYPWLYSGYYDPFWYWDHGSSYDDDYDRDRAVAMQMNQQSLEELRERRNEDGDLDLYAQPRSSDAREYQREEAGEVQPAEPQPVTVLVFRDQHKQEVQNYAIVGQTLWAFNPQHNQKIPVADLDLAATTRANDERGVTFRAPTSNEAQ